MKDQSLLLLAPLSYGVDSIPPCLEVGTDLVHWLSLFFQISFSHPFYPSSTLFFSSQNFEDNFTNSLLILLNDL